MGAFLGVAKWLRRPIIEVAEKLGYSEENIIILKGDINKLKDEFPDAYKNLISCRHHADKRTPIQYGQDLIATWIVEDLILRKLNAAGLAVQLGGADKSRKILPNTKIKTTSDYKLIFKSNETKKIELMCDYTGFWARNEKLHLRDDKYLQLISSKAWMLAVSVETNQFILYDFGRTIEAKYISNHKFYGGKPAYEIAATQKKMKNFNIKEVVIEIEKLTKESKGL